MQILGLVADRRWRPRGDIGHVATVEPARARHAVVDRAAHAFACAAETHRPAIGAERSGIGYIVVAD